MLDENLPEIQEHVPADELERAKSNLERLWGGVNQQEAILYERTITDEKTARELFIRRNKAGKVLSGVDILLALLTGYWKNVNEDGGPTDAKKQIEEFTERLSSDEALSKWGFTFGKNFVLRTLLLFSGERPAFRKNGRYDGDDLREAETVFHNTGFEQSIRDAFTFASNLGFHNGALSSKNVVSPVIQFLYQTGASPESNRSAIHYWLATTVLNGIFGNIGSERVLKTARGYIEESEGGEFPATQILNDLRGSGAVVRLDGDVLDELLGVVDYRSGSRRNVLLTHLYRDRRAGHKQYEVDHIFPRGKLGDEEFLRENGVAPDRINWFKDNRDHIANLQLLSSHENQSKSDRDLTDWLERIDDDKIESIADREEYFDQHWIPANRDLHEYSQFPEFIEARSEQMSDRLETELPLKKPNKSSSNGGQSQDLFS